MYVTLHLSDGRKITQERENLIILRPNSQYKPDAVEGKITVNWGHVMYMHPAEDEEIKHSKIHGW